MAEEDKVETEDEEELLAEQLDNASFFLANEYYHEEQKFDQAIENYKSVLENTDDELVRAKSLYRMGESYVKLHQIEKAIEIFSQLIDEIEDHYLVSSAERRIEYLRETYGGQKDE